ncbi:glycosyl hydrolase [Clostridium sp.]|uniref:glycosyl hydrolase n=1 Tax=Clostridium sp. TaxID=1506 RepID=UPI002A92020A|nr:glycosyl hydrolase [Clostridium sp.]MDY6011417.1 glycosyl hydrolase [Clostridium sp.]
MKKIFKKKFIFNDGVGFSILLILLMIARVSIPYIFPIYDEFTYNNNNKVSEREEILFDFIDKKLTNNDDGIKTYYTNVNSEQDINKENSVSSQSEVMMLLYYLERNDKKSFDRTLKYIEKNMFLSSNLVSSKVKEGEKDKISRSVDNLRIVNALLLASQRWGGLKYRQVAINIEKAIDKNLLYDGALVDSSDGQSKDYMITLSYLDLQTMKRLSYIDFNWKKIYTQSLRVLDNGYISAEVPLYKNKYNMKTEEYDTEDIDMVSSLRCILNKAEVSKDVSESINWITEKFKKDGAIYSKYNFNTGNKVSDEESVSIYALLVQIAKKTGNDDLYNMSLKKLKKLQVMDKNSNMYGGYEDLKTLDAYSIDNLNALLAYRYVK